MNKYGPWLSKTDTSDDRDFDSNDLAMEIAVNGFLSLIDPFEFEEVPIRTATHNSKLLDNRTMVTCGLREFPFASSSTPARVLMVTAKSPFTLDKVRLPDGRLAFVVEPGPFNFAGLPTELRDMIFKMHYDTDKIVKIQKRNKTDINDPLFAQPRLTQDETSPFYLGNMIGREALCAFYRYTEFELADVHVAASFLTAVRPFIHVIRKIRIFSWDDLEFARTCMKRLTLAVNLQQVAVKCLDTKTVAQFVKASDIWLMANGNSIAAVDKLYKLVHNAEMGLA